MNPERTGNVIAHITRPGLFLGKRTRINHFLNHTVVAGQLRQPLQTPVV